MRRFFCYFQGKGHSFRDYRKQDADSTDSASELLDPNHTHFIFVDNGKVGKDALGSERGFRTAFVTLGQSADEDKIEKQEETTTSTSKCITLPVIYLNDYDERCDGNVMWCGA